MIRIERCSWWACDASPRARWWFLQLAASDGVTGSGECSDGGTTAAMERALTSLTDEIAHALTLDDAGDVLHAWHARRDAARAPAERHLCATIAAALETALADIAAQQAGEPLWRRFAPARCTAAVTLYANINRGVRDRTPAGFARAAAEACADGFATVKCAPFDDDPPPGRTLAHAGLERIAAIRDAVGARTELLVDLHERLPVSTVLAITAELEALDVGWLEDAVIFHDVENLRRIKHATAIPLAGGEQALTLADIVPALEAGLLDVISPDVKHAGLAETLAIARYATGAGHRVSLHNPTGPVATAASLHVVAALTKPGLLEFAYDALAARGAVIAPPEFLDHATLAVPDVPGLGVSLVPPAQERSA